MRKGVKEVIEECLGRLNQILLVEKKEEFDHSDILWTCGPDIITSVYHKSRQHYKNIHLLNTGYVHHKSYGSWR